MKQIIDNYLRLLENHTPIYYEHSLRLAPLSARIGELNGLSQSDIDILSNASLLHDFGKIRVPQSILHKPEQLSEEEMALVKKHVRAGASLIIEEGFEAIKPVMLMHHEFSPNPYPRNGERRNGHRNNGSDRRRKIDFRTYSLAQMLAVSDQCDGLLSDRPYRPAVSKDEAREILEKDFKGERKYIDQVLSLV